MKKLLYIFMIAAVLVSCKKNTTETPAPANQQTQEVTFDINTILESTDREYSVPNCIPVIDNEENKYAVNSNIRWRTRLNILILLKYIM